MKEKKKKKKKKKSCKSGVSGEISEAIVRRHPVVKLPMGTGHVEYGCKEDAEKAIKYMDGGQIDGKEVGVGFAVDLKGRRGGLGKFQYIYCSAF